ncbi:hypothetical protein [Enterobacter ludwigii]|uniref:hypothetical protein n=1 Tax=Enterobacter ludwigii TaxID=299767 RepID=UPI003F710018
MITEPLRRFRWQISGLILLGLVSAGMVRAGSAAARSLSASADVRMVTTWQFRGSPLTVDDSLPVGTVIAVAQAPEKGERYALAGDITGGLWCRSAYAASPLTVSTDLDGVMARIITEKQSGAREAGTHLPYRPWRQGGIRIELVKSGQIRNGWLTRLKEPVEYRLQAGRKNGKVVLREVLRPARALRIRVTKSVSSARKGAGVKAAF